MPYAPKSHSQLTAAKRRNVSDVRKYHKASDARRPSASKRGYDARWRSARKRYLAHHGQCARCGSLDDADLVVDHIVPHRGDRAMFWDPTNWQTLCKRCHDVKTATEDAHDGHRGSKSYPLSP